MAAPPEEPCSYCGARLNPRYYFCLACATPYQPDAAVLPPEPRLRPTIGMRIRQSAPQVMTICNTYLAVVLGGGILAWLLFREQRPVATLVFLDALMVVTTLVFTVRYWPAVWLQLRRPGFGHWEAWAGLLALPALLFVDYAWHGWIQELAGGGAGNYVTALIESGAPAGALYLSLAVLPGIGEEIAFRGLVQHWLLAAIPPRNAILIAAAYFAGLHFTLVSAPYLFLLGCVLGWLRWRTGSLWPCIAVHTLHNAAVLAWHGA
jgi:membrane protease YdiL (CAAX protease family)